MQILLETVFNKQERRLFKRNRRFIITDKKVDSSSDSDDAISEVVRNGPYVSELRKGMRLRFKKDKEYATRA